MKNISIFEASLAIFYKIEHPYHMIQQLYFGIYPNELKHVHAKTHTCVFMAALLITAKTWKQQRCPSVGECVSKLWHPDNGILLSTMNIHLSSNERTRRNPRSRVINCNKCITLVRDVDSGEMGKGGEEEAQALYIVLCEFSVLCSILLET